MINGLTENYSITSSMQKISSIHRFIFLSWDKSDFGVPGPKKLQPYLTICLPKITFSFPNTMYEHAKNQLNSFIHSWDTADYRVLLHKRTPIFDHAHPITIKATFTFLKRVLACKNSATFIRLLKLESHAHFWPLSRAGKIRCTVVSCAYHAPKLSTRRTKKRVPCLSFAS